METSSSLIGEVEKPILHVHSARDIAPFADGRATGLLLKRENGRWMIAEVLDIDPRKWKIQEEGVDPELWRLKYPGPRSGTPGGLPKDYGKEKGVEDRIEAMVNEIWEEAGVRVEQEDLLPLCKITNIRAPKRNKMGQDEGERGKIEYSVFAHVGDLELRETDDEDAKQPRWVDLFGEVLTPDSNWYPQHLVVLMLALHKLLEMFPLFFKGDLDHPQDISFFEKIARTDEAVLDPRKVEEVEAYRQELLGLLETVNPLEILEEVHIKIFAQPKEGDKPEDKMWREMQARRSAYNLLKKHTALSLGSKEYFEPDPE